MRISYILKVPSGFRMSRRPGAWADALSEFLPSVSGVSASWAGADKVRVTFDGTQETLDILAMDNPGLEVTVDGKKRTLKSARRHDA
jgi:hypothetical protein